MSFDDDPNDQARISGADFSMMCDEMKQLKRSNADLLEALERLRDAEKAPRSEWKLAIANADIAIAKAKGEVQ
jgi:hypothetical protein